MDIIIQEAYRKAYRKHTQNKANRKVHGRGGIRLYRKRTECGQKGDIIRAESVLTESELTESELTESELTEWMHIEWGIIRTS